MTAIAYTNRKNFFDNVDRTAYTLASWTPVSNAPFLALVVNRQASGTPATPTLTGNGLTWTQIDTQLVGAGLIRMTTFYAAGIASPTTGTLVADFGGVTQDVGEVIVDQLTNANQTTPVNTSNKQKAQGSAITSIATSSLSAIDGNASVWAASAAQVNEAQTADATMTLIVEVHTTSSPCAAMTQYGTTLAPSESSATSQSRGIMAIEVNNAVPAAVSVNAENAAGTGAASGASETVAASAGNSAGTGAAYNATVSISSVVSANAGAATGTGAASAPSISLAPAAATATGTGTAYAPSLSLISFANSIASGTGAAYGAAISFSLSAGIATGTGTAYGMAGHVYASAGVATGTANGYDSSIVATNSGGPGIAVTSVSSAGAALNILAPTATLGVQP